MISFKNIKKNNPVHFFFVIEGNSFPDGGVISSVSSDQSQLQPIECK